VVPQHSRQTTDRFLLNTTKKHLFQERQSVRQWYQGSGIVISARQSQMRMKNPVLPHSTDLFHNDDDDDYEENDDYEETSSFTTLITPTITKNAVSATNEEELKIPELSAKTPRRKSRRIAFTWTNTGRNVKSKPAFSLLSKT
jgi:hypothetical protein